MNENSENAKVTNEGTSEFEAAASEKWLIIEFWEFLLDNKKFWLLPIILVLMLLGLLIVFSGSSAAPFIYTLF